MARGKYAHQSHGPSGPVILILILVALLAVGLAVTALVRSLHNEDPLPEVNDILPGQQQEQQPPAQDNTQPPAEDEALKARRADLLAQAEALIQGYYYDDAIALLQNAGELTNTDTAALLQDVRGLKDSLVKYEGGQYSTSSSTVWWPTPPKPLTATGKRPVTTTL